MTNRNCTFYVSDDKLGHFAENTAKMLELSKFDKAKSVSKRIYENLKTIRTAVKTAEEYAASGNRMPKPAEWLSDNWYIAEREGRGAIRDLKNIRLTRSTDAKGTPLILYAASELVRSGAGEVSRERLSIFLEGFQNAVALRERELSMFLPALKAALVSELSEVAEHTEDFMKAGEVCGEKESRLRKEHVLAAAAERVITSLRLLSSVDVSKILEAVNKTEQTLRGDPSGVYPKMDDKTRIYYRRKISELSRKTDMEEHKIAEIIVGLAGEGSGKSSHVGYFIFERPLGKEAKKRSGSCYISAVVITSLFFSLLLGFALSNALIAIMLFLPVSEIVKNVTDFLVIKFCKPRLVPKLELKEGVPPEGKTLCVISALLSSDEACAELPRLLEEYYLSNRECGANLLFGILADLPEAKTEYSETDDHRLRIIQKEIEKLNGKYGGFFLFTRARVYSEANGRYMGWERKRGAITELVRLLSGAESNLFVVSGNRELLDGTRYMITLDSDTRLGVDSARELIGAMLHPLNRAEIDAERKVVTAGHGILQPRVSVDLKAANRSDFTRLFAGQGGIDPYGNAAGDVYNDLFDEGSFMGKGIIDVNAFRVCLDRRFPENLVLSHDLLEGAYLRAGFAGDVEFTDGYPYKTSSYYERLHRWTRGDWQISGWLFSKVPDGAGSKATNPLNQLNKWKIFDNLRRSTAPVASFAALYTGMLSKSFNFTVAASVAELSAVSALLISSAELVFRRDVNTKARYHSTIISGFGAALTQTLVQLIFLPYQAYISLHAIITALYRMKVSKKNLLSWVTAAESEKKKNDGLLPCCRRMYAPVLIGAAAVFLSKSAAGSAVGLVWLASPVCAASLSREKKKRQILAEDEKLFLIRAANEIWRYFCELTGPHNNYLPPDNYQEEPYIGAAERTSPTNIGLALLSALAAMDMKLAGAEKAPEFIENMISAVERLPKWKGHLYNWYDTETLSPLGPPYISSVDSGNLAGALIVLREGLLEMGGNFNGLAERAGKLADSMDFGPLFDEERQLFRIGLEPGGKPSEGWYDLMASEARQTSYIAIARGFVNKKHWRRLGRVLVSKDNFYGMASWTGTMFEYLMPNLIMPCYENSMLFESMKFCVYVQKKAFSPWGMSESAFYSFDPNMNYQYKAHGAGGLALKRGQEKECVISPYSSFLALQVFPKSAVKNLKKLSQMGMEGRYGFFEAADFTPSRQMGKKFETVKCFMAHHLGMSIIAADNAVNDGIMQKRFMRDREMAAYSELLQEKVPLGQVVLSKPSREVPEKPRIHVLSGWKKSGEGVSLQRPSAALLSNGSYAVALSETGASRSMWKDRLVTAFDGAPAGESQGISFFLKMGDEVISLLPQPDFDGKTQFSFVFTDRYGEICARREEFVSYMNVMVSPELHGELRSIRLINKLNRSLEAELVCYFEPVMASKADHYAHPAFSKLALETKLSGGAIVVKRRSNGKRKSLFLAFACDREMRFDTSREIALGRGGLRQIPNALNREPQYSLGAVLDPCVLARVKLLVKPSEETELRFSISAAKSEEEAVASAEAILKMPASGGAVRVGEAARSIGANSEDIDAAMEMLSSMVFFRENYKERLGITRATGSKETLWKLGISGDLPVVSVIAENEECAEKVRRVLHSYKILRKSGLKFDMVFITNDGADYRKPAKSMLTGMLCELGFENDFGNGIYISDRENFEELACASSKIIDCAETSDKNESRDYPKPNKAFWKKEPGASGAIRHYYDENGAFYAELTGVLPEVAWSDILTNGRYGYLASDSGTGHMWHINARENKINVWQNDVLAVEGSERIFLGSGEKDYSLFADADGLECRVCFGFGYAAWEKKIAGTAVRTTAFVPPDLDARILIIELGEASAFERLSYFTELILGAETVQNGIYLKAEENMIHAENRGNAEFPGESFITACSGKIVSFSDRDMRARTPRSIAAEFQVSDCVVLISGCAGEESIARLLKPEAAKAELERTIRYWKEKLGSISFSTPDAALDGYMNGWAMYQTLASRLLGRTSMYQNGGAYGFRDQLQDVICLMQHHPELAKAQIKRASEHQFLEGDVQHWWHPNGLDGQCDKGVRTRCSDDLLWLPYAVCRYAEVTGDLDFLREESEYISSCPLKKGERERYELPQKSGVRENLIQHARRALDLALGRGAGEHGLSLIGGGDWNDGFDRLGADGRGESVWLTWFAAYTAERFSLLCSEIGERELSERYSASARGLAEAANSAWDGKWFLRAYFDDGTPIGRKGDAECEIDSIAQSFSAWSSYADKEKSEKAISSAVDILFDRSNKIVKLFSPPFSGEGMDPGYIRGYVPGVRENGGQYTHAAVWLALGCLKIGKANEAWEILSAILPSNHSLAQYKAEPFVLAADVYSNPLHVGRAGWNWYTGAAAWYFSVVEEELLGIKLRGGKLRLEPKLPDSWEGYCAVLKTPDAEFHIKVERDEAGRMLVDGRECIEKALEIKTYKGLHKVCFEIK